MGLGEEIEIYEHQPVILDVRTPTKPILGLWVKTLPDATYLVIGKFHHLVEVELPPRNEGVWLALRDVRKLLPVAWPKGSSTQEQAFVVLSVNLVKGSVKIQLSNHYRPTRQDRKKL